MVLGATAVGFVAARADGNRDVRRESAHRAEIAATEIRGRVERGAARVEALRRFMVSAVSRGVTSEQFANLQSQGLGEAGLPAAAWIERVSGSQRRPYERRVGPIVAASRSGGLVPVGPREFYLPATLATGAAPMTEPGVDLGEEPGVAAAIARPRTLYRVTATRLVTLRDGARGLFLLQSAQRVSGGVVKPGVVALFVPDSWLLEATTEAAQQDSPLQLIAGGGSSGDLDGAAPARSAFTAVGQRFEVRVPLGSLHGAAALLPWLILAAGLVFAAFTGALGVNGARRARAQRELDRIFGLSPDLIAIASFDGYFTRVNPAIEPILGYTEEEFLARPYLELVHPDDLARTEAEASAMGEGKSTRSFENRYAHKDGSYRWLEWTSAPAVEERLMYGVARDVTQRRQAETELRAAEEQYRSLAQEQAALRRVATLIAQGVPPAEVFMAVAEEAARILDVSSVAVTRYASDGTSVVVASFNDPGFPVGSRWPHEAPSLNAKVFETRSPARIDNYSELPGPVAAAARASGVDSSVGVPITVGGSLWGMITAGRRDRRGVLPADIDARLAAFTELVATAVSNAQAHDDLRQLADEQAALRRVATLVAAGTGESDLMEAVTAEVGRLFGGDSANLVRVEGSSARVVGGWSRRDFLAWEPGAVFPIAGDTATGRAIQSGRPERVDSPDKLEEAFASDLWREHGIHSTLATPIVVERSLWGVISVSRMTPETFAAGAEDRLGHFAALVAQAIANAQGRAELTASRARVVAAFDDARRRIERDLHDGAQQQLVSLALELQAAEQLVPRELGELRSELSSIAQGLVGAVDDLREMSRGIHPGVLVNGGLAPALLMLARRSPVPVEIDMRARGRLPEPVEVAAYYVVSEALANATKHARASVVRVAAEKRDNVLRLSIGDDGVGGADPAKGSGLIGLRDRVEALGGSIEFISRLGEGTVVVVALPLWDDRKLVATVPENSVL